MPERKTESTHPPAHSLRDIFCETMMLSQVKSMMIFAWIVRWDHTFERAQNSLSLISDSIPSQGKNVPVPGDGRALLVFVPLTDKKVDM